MGVGPRNPPQWSHTHDIERPPAQDSAVQLHCNLVALSLRPCHGSVRPCHKPRNLTSLQHAGAIHPPSPSKLPGPEDIRIAPPPPKHSQDHRRGGSANQGEARSRVTFSQGPQPNGRRSVQDSTWESHSSPLFIRLVDMRCAVPHCKKFLKGSLSHVSSA